MYAALILTLYIRYGDADSGSIILHLWPFTILYVAWLIVFYSQGFYDLTTAKNNLAFWSSFLKTVLINAAIGTIFFYFVPIFQITPKTNFIINTVIFAILFVLWRQIFNFLLQNKLFQQNILFIGYNQDTQNVINKLDSNPQLGFKTKLVIKPQAIKSAIELMEIINKNLIHIIVVADNPHENQKLTQILFQCLPLQIQIYNLAVFYEKITGKIPINTINQIWFLENLTESEHGFYESTKRVIDIIFSSLFGLITILAFPFIALLVKISSPGHIFYRQKRIGANEKLFTLTKFRSMFEDAESNGPQWTIKNDRRVTPIGNFLRRTFLDELPQLLSILKGEMSFIGPRPERPEFIQDLEKKIPFYQMRHLVKPGLTGWAQINFRYGSSIEDSMEKLQYDIYYIKNRSMLLDIGIILKTIKLIFKER